MIKNALVQECIDVLKREDVKTEFKTFMTPIIDIILIEINPYLYLCMMFVIISFLLHLGIFVLLLRNKSFNFKVYQTIRKNGGWENWSMVEIEKFSCQDGNEAVSRERHWYEELEAKLNMRVPNRGQKEYNKKYID